MVYLLGEGRSGNAISDHRPYSEESALKFIRDILDGYFPYEFKKDYPNGIPFKVTDKHTEEYSPEFLKFQGEGHKLNKIKGLSEIGDTQYQLSINLFE